MTNDEKSLFLATRFWSALLRFIFTWTTICYPLLLNWLFGWGYWQLAIICSVVNIPFVVIVYGILFFKANQQEEK